MINIPIWVFVLLCIAAAPVAILIVIFAVLAVFIAISLIIVLFSNLFTEDDDTPIKINKADFYEDPDYNPEYIPKEEREK